MSLNCILPKICGAEMMRRPAGDDRPFPEQDYLVFPLENMYDRIVLPHKGVTEYKRQSVANNNSQTWRYENNENNSTCEAEGK